LDIKETTLHGCIHGTAINQVELSFAETSEKRDPFITSQLEK
jgi:hypothetical protein